MIVTGYKIRNAIRRWQLIRDAAMTQFPSSLTTFEGESKASPSALDEEFTTAELAIAKLQAAQAVYNSLVKVGNTTLGFIIKHLGGAARREKMWRQVVAPAREKWRRGMEIDISTRSKDQIASRWTMTLEEMTRRAADAASYAARLRSDIAEANAAEIDMNLDESLFK